jgi:TolB-like protein
MFRTRLFVVLLIVFVLPVALLGEKYAVCDLKPVGVSVSLADAVVTLLRSDLSSYKNITLVELTEKVVIEDKESAAELGFKAKAQKVVYGTISKLGEKYIISANVVDVSSHNIVYQDRIAASSAEDLDITSKRLAKSIATGKKVEATAEIGKITEEETKEPRRRRNFHTVGGKFGWGFPIGSDSYGGASALMGGDFIYWYETQNVIAEFAFNATMTPLSTSYEFDTTQTEEATITAAEVTYGQLSLLYLFSKEDICPYAGGGIGLRNLMITDERVGGKTESAFGMGLNVNGGIIAFRTYDFRVFLDASYSLNFANLKTFGGPHHAFKIAVGVTYKKEMGGGGGCGGGGCGGGGCL